MLTEAQGLFNRWRWEYNILTHSGHDGRTPIVAAQAAAA